MNQAPVPIAVPAEEAEAAATHPVDAAQALRMQDEARQPPLRMPEVYEPTSHVMLFALTSALPWKTPTAVLETTFHHWSTV